MLEKYLNQPNLIKSIINLEVLQGKSKESGSIYYYVELTFINGYKKRIFLRSEEEFAWTNAFDLSKAESMDSLED